MDRRDLYALARSLYLGTRDEQKLVVGRKKQRRSRLLRKGNGKEDATRGTPNRPPLPLEIIRQIFRLSECHVQIPTPPWEKDQRIRNNPYLHYSDHNSLSQGYGFDRNRFSRRTSWFDMASKSMTFFFIGPVTADHLRRTLGLQLETVSRGYSKFKGTAPREGQQTCFKISLYERTPIFTSQDGSIDREKTNSDRRSHESQLRRCYGYPGITLPSIGFGTLFHCTKDDPDLEEKSKINWTEHRLRFLEIGSGKTTPLSWISHYSGPHPSSTPGQHTRGLYFCPSHEIWEYLREGDWIGVSACVASRGSKCEVEKAELKVWSVFEPINLAILQSYRRPVDEATSKSQNDAENQPVCRAAGRKWFRSLKRLV
jgi:hypothetical protein